MAFDTSTRNRLNKFVSETRGLLTDEFTNQFKQDYGLDPDTGEVADLDRLDHLEDARRQTAVILRDTLQHYYANLPTKNKDPNKDNQQLIERIIREQAFTVLNRLCAIRMAEARDLVIQSVTDGVQSKGFQLYQHVVGSSLGETGAAYQQFLFSIFDEFAVDLPVLFDRFSPQGRLFPRESVLVELLEQINHSDIDPLWAEDETIGWIYQYFNSKEERKAMRDASQAPRNSRELAVRNQFFTPRYVVEFLTDNTLGRIWYEMRQGQTRLVDECQYLVRRPNEVFLHRSTDESHENAEEAVVAVARQLTAATEEEFPEFSADNDDQIQRMISFAHCVSAYQRRSEPCQWLESQKSTIQSDRLLELPTQDLWDILFLTCRSDRQGGDGRVYLERWFVDSCNEIRSRLLNSSEKDLTQEELLNQPVLIPHRSLKDPREIRMLDPACGSMHFGLYAFDLYLKIYEEYWDLITESPETENHTPKTENLPPLAELYPDKPTFLRDVPRLIIEHNIHGIDIDPRAVQIAGLSLWLRAQRAWKSQGIAAGDRPQVTRSNIVCAEPMPGDEQQLAAFCQELHPAIAQMVTAIFEEMKLAGEAGSLLKIEQEISSLVAAAKQQYKDNPPDKKTQQSLFGGASVVEEQQLEFDLSGITDQQFFEQAEETIYEALRKYASETSEGGFRRKLFAGDAAKGFAFVELSRKRFDATLMNPPFGSPTDRVLNELGRFFPTGRTDIAAAFILRGLDLSTGKVGAIVTRSLFLMPGAAEWREKILNLGCFPDSLADFGGGVLDAFVETAAGIYDSTPLTPCVFFDCRDGEDKATPLLKSNSSLRSGELPKSVYLRSSEDFKTIPLAPFCYWVDNGLLGLFRRFDRFEPTHGAARTGLATLDNFRFLRCWWEVSQPKTSIESENWKPLAKGGDTWPYFGEIDQRVLWGNDGYELKCFVAAKVGSISRKIQAQEYYGRPGITWIQRSQLGFCPRPLPRNAIFDTKGPSAFQDTEGDLLATMGMFSSALFQEILDLQVSSYSYHPGVVQRSPFPQLTQELLLRISSLTRRAVEISAEMRLDETMGNFGIPQVLSAQKQSSLESALNVLNGRDKELTTELVKCAREIELATHEAYGLSNSQAVSERCERIGERMSIVQRKSENYQFREIISWLLGVAFGRWDIRRSDTELNATSEFDSFAQIPVCPPGTLTDANGYALDTHEVPEDYPLSVSSGILVEDATHEQCIAKKIQEGIALLWPSDDVLQEMCSAIGVSSLEDYVNKPNSFFSDHLKQYSKSRREAPIYWPISTESGSYTLWFYYHRLTDQTLYLAVNDFVDPKLKETLRQLADLRAIKDRSSPQEKELAQLTELESELEQFKADLLEIAAFWKPNLNDGVQITAAPLWKFFRLTKWRNKLKKTWSELESGKYDWAHLALSIWPDRVVREKCTTDRSIAIAHDLEEQLWEEREIQKTSKTGRVTTKMQWMPRELSDKELDKIVDEVKAR